MSVCIFNCVSAQLNMGDQDEFRCFIGNLSWSTSDRGLKQAFEKFGHLVEAKVQHKSFFAFVTVDLWSIYHG